MNDSAIAMLDLIVGGVVLISALLAFYRGFVREALSIVGWVGAALVAVWFFADARPVVTQWVEIDWLADLITAVGLFVATLVVISLLTHLIVMQVKGSPLSALDRSLGFLFGIARGIIVLALAYMAAERALWAEQTPPDWVQDARSLPIIQQAAGLIVATVPKGTFNLPIEGFDDIQRKALELDAARRRIEELQRMSEPPIETPEMEPDKGYDNTDIQGMDRLMDGVQNDDPAAGE